MAAAANDHQNSRAPRRKDGTPRISGLFLAFMSGFTVSISSLMTKLATSSTFLQITLVRAIVIGGFMLVWCLAKGHWSSSGNLLPNLPIRTLGWLVMRSFSSFVAMMTIYAVYKKVPMGDASAIFGVTPVFSGLLSIVMLGEAWQQKHIHLTLLAWTGIIFIYKPQFLINALPHVYDGFEVETANPPPDKFYLLLALLVPVGSSLSFVISRKLSQSTPQSMIICVTFIGVTLYSCVVMATVEGISIPPFRDWKFLIPEIVAGLASQALTGEALKREAAASVTLMRNSTIIFSFIFQFVFFGNVPSWSSVVGALMIVSSTALLAAT
ncbi:solute carrier family 35 member G1-like [Diadema antillarum]|uniref:solute carrier family 35 member G1-like n=1 Tax=Diadema antillarum TaxID=105358 RepID=UPI003A89EBC6